MAFDDLARRMRETHGRKRGDVSQTSDPDQIIANAVKSDRRANIVNDLVLGPILFVGGGVVSVLAFHVRSQDGSLNYMRVAAAGATVVGLFKILRGLARLVSG